MKRNGWSGTAALLVAAVVWAGLPAAPAQAETGDDSTGAAVAVGLMAAVVVVYALVSLRADVDRYSQAETEAAIARAVQAAEESPIVLQAVTAPLGLETPGTGSQTQVAGAAIGWRVSF